MSDTSHILRDRIYAQYRSASPMDPGVPGAELSVRRPYLSQIVRRFFPSDRQSRILDLGCGAGTLLAVAREAGYVNGVGIDISPEQVAVAQREGRGYVKSGDFLKALKAEVADSVDCVVCIDVLEHLDDGELVAMVDGVHAALRSGGCFVIHVPNGESPLAGRVLYGDLTHRRAFTRISLPHLLLASGFSSARCFEDAPIAHGLNSFIRSLLWKGIRTLLRFASMVETGELGRNAIYTQNLFCVARK